MTTTTDELKRCPFCGYTGRETDINAWTLYKSLPSQHTEWAISCRNCGAIGPRDLSIQGAYAMWNLRREDWPPETKVQP